MKTITIEKDFSNTPGGRYIKEGPNSGEEFRKKILLPMYEAVIRNGEKLEINFDGCYGYATSFLEEAFGGLVRELKQKGILKNIIIISMDDATIEELIQGYVKEAERNLDM